jgi:hypothetical protein
MTSEPCAKCKSVGFIRPEQAEVLPPHSEWDHMGYVKCDACDGTGSVEARDSGR